MLEKHPEVPQPYAYPPPLPPEQSPVPTAATIAHSRWQLENAPHRTAAEFARRWVSGMELADPAVSSDFVDRRVIHQLIQTDSYPTTDGGWLKRDDFSKVTHNAWLLSVLHPDRPDRSRISPATIAVAEGVGERWVNRMVHEAWEENERFDREVAQRAKEEQLRQRADHDPLTGLYNREGWSEQTLLRGEGGQPLIIIQLDVDRFKAVNDIHGHARGDQVLVALGNILGRYSRGSDVIARRIDSAIPSYRGDSESVAGRSGGDEYVITLSPLIDRDPVEGNAPASEDDQHSQNRRGHTGYDPVEQANRYIERIRSVFDQWLQTDGNEDIRGIGLGLSAGFSIWSGDTSLDRDHLTEQLRNADVGMYNDKQQRRRAETWSQRSPEEQAGIRHHLMGLARYGVTIDPRLVGLPADVLGLVPEDR